MFTMTDFTMSQDTFRKVAPFRQDADKWTQIAGVYLITDDVSQEDFEAAFAMVEQEMAKVIAREGMEKAAAGITVNKTITQMAKDASLLGFSLSISYDEATDKAQISIVGKRGRKAAQDGEVSSGSNISAWTAYKKGKKDGDTFVITKVEGGYKHVERFIPQRANGGLVNYLLKMFPSSKSAAILTRYGKTISS